MFFPTFKHLFFMVALGLVVISQSADAQEADGGSTRVDLAQNDPRRSEVLGPLRDRVSPRMGSELGDIQLDVLRELPRDRFGVPAPTVKPSGRLFPSSLNRPNHNWIKQEVDPRLPDPITEDRMTRPPINSALSQARPEDLIALLAAREQPAETERRRLCGSAIEGLRQNILMPPHGFRNAIDDMEDVCIASPAATNQMAINARRECARRYRDVALHCFKEDQPAGVLRQRILDVSGILSFRIQNDAREIACSGVLVTPRHFLTAAHCLAALGSFGHVGSPEVHLRDGSAYDVIAIMAAPSFGRIALDATAAIEALRHNAITDDDLAILELGAAAGIASDQFPELKKPSEGRASVLSGFQRLLHQGLTLRSIAEHGDDLTDEDLIQTKAWQQAAYPDGTSTCRTISLTQQEAQVQGRPTSRLIGHMCQALVNSSGAPIFEMTDSGALNLLAIHLGATRDLNALSTAPVESRQPRNTAVLLADSPVEVVIRNLRR